MSSAWNGTTEAAAILGVSAQFLRKTLIHQLKAGKHYRCKNPQAPPRGRRYVWKTALIEPLLIPHDAPEAEDG
jgi:hypothetical protein